MNEEHPIVLHLERPAFDPTHVTLLILSFVEREIFVSFTAGSDILVNGTRVVCGRVYENVVFRTDVYASGTDEFVVRKGQRSMITHVSLGHFPSFAIPQFLRKSGEPYVCISPGHEYGLCTSNSTLSVPKEAHGHFIAMDIIVDTDPTSTMYPLVWFRRVTLPFSIYPSGKIEIFNNSLKRSENALCVFNTRSVTPQKPRVYYLDISK